MYLAALLLYSVLGVRRLAECEKANRLVLERFGQPYREPRDRSPASLSRVFVATAVPVQLAILGSTCALAGVLLLGGTWHVVSVISSGVSFPTVFVAMSWVKDTSSRQRVLRPGALKPYQPHGG
jgi:hypothetical protein